MDNQTIWRDFLANWPAEIERRGILVTTFDEQIPFDGFMLSPTMLLVDRRTPDTSGARKILLPLSSIAAIKLTDVIKNKPFASLGFGEVRAKTSPSTSS